jgi:serine/threonine protein kinase
MKPERWRRIDEIYNAALEQRPEDRDAFVEQACAGDEPLRSEIEDLLARKSEAGSFLDFPAMDVAARDLAADRASGPEDLAGRTIAHYRIEEKIGEGGMGVVFRAHDTHLNRPIALKVLPPGLIADPERRHRFVQEARAASALNHPNIVTIHDIDQAGDIHFIAMEYVRGKTLAEMIPPAGMDLRDALGVAIQIAGALSAAHAAGIIHRDLKPGNVMAGEDGRIRMLDFGLAKLMEEPAGPFQRVSVTEPRTQTGAVLGTGPYMSPEQAEGRPVDNRSDVFSFGSMLYEMVTGRRAFQGDARTSTLRKILDSEPEPITRAVPADLQRIIFKCLRKEPERRFQHIGDVKTELEAVLRETGHLTATRRTIILLILGAAAVVLPAAGLWPFLARLFHEGSPPLVVQPLTALVGRETSPSLSPDGRQVVFAWSGETGHDSDLYIQPVTGGLPRRLTNDPANDQSPSWSRDGSEIAFVRYLPPKTVSVHLISPGGGPERQIANYSMPVASYPDWAFFLAGFSTRMAWTPDGRSLAASEWLGGARTRLVLFSKWTGEKQSLTSPPPGTLALDMHCTFSPDGKQIAFARQLMWDSYDIWTAAVPGGAPRRVTYDDQVADNPVWTPDGKEIVFRSNRLGTTNLWRIRADALRGTEPTLIPDTEGAAAVTISKGPPVRLVFVRQMHDVNIWQAERLPDGSGYGPSSPLVHSTREDANPQFSPDGRKIVFGSNRDGRKALWIADSDGSNPRLLSRKGGAFDWSPDSSRIAFGYAGIDLFVVDANGGQPVPLKTEDSGEGRPHWSRDGKWLYFHSDRSGASQIWKMPVAGGDPVQVTTVGGLEGWESPHGKMFYFVKDAPGLWVVPTNGGKETRVLDNVRAGCWALADAGIYYIDSVTSTPPAIRFFDFSTRSIKQVLVPGRMRNTNDQNLTVTRDGRRIAWPQIDRDDADLMQIENFR